MSAALTGHQRLHNGPESGELFGESKQPENAEQSGSRGVEFGARVRVVNTQRVEMLPTTHVGAVC